MPARDGVDGLADVTEQIDTAVAGAVWRARRVEPLDHLRPGSQGPLAARSLLGSGSRDGGAQQGNAQGEGREDAHVVSLPAHWRRTAPPHPRLWRTHAADHPCGRLLACSGPPPRLVWQSSGASRRVGDA